MLRAQFRKDPSTGDYVQRGCVHCWATCIPQASRRESLNIRWILVGGLQSCSASVQTRNLTRFSPSNSKVRIIMAIRVIAGIVSTMSSRPASRVKSIQVSYHDTLSSTSLLSLGLSAGPSMDQVCVQGLGFRRCYKMRFEGCPER